MILLLMVLTNTRLPLNFGRILIFYLMKRFCFTLIHYKIENVSEAFGEVHALCRIEFLNNSQHAFRSMNISKLHTKCLSVVIVRSKNEIEYLLPDRSCLWLEILFALYATRNGTLTLFDTKRYHCSFINRNSWWIVETVWKSTFSKLHH